MKNVIVTGANGFVGKALVYKLIEQKINVIAMDLLGHNSNLPKSDLVTFIPFSLEKIHAYKDEIKKYNPDTFFNFAWTGSAGDLRRNYELQLKNALWTIEAIKFARDVGCNRFVNAGSIAEIETYKACFINGSKPAMGYIYGSGKLVAHTMCKSVAAEIGIDLMWAMITNSYGVGEISPRLINSTIQKCIKGITPSFTSGNQIYDFVYITDIANAFYLIGKSGKPFSQYIIGSGDAKPLKFFLQEMNSTIAPEINFNFGNIPFTGISLSLEDYDITNLKNDTGFTPEVDFSTGCKLTMDWLKEKICKGD